jgi:hypothetical protein
MAFNINRLKSRFGSQDTVPKKSDDSDTPSSPTPASSGATSPTLAPESPISDPSTPASEQSENRPSGMFGRASSFASMMSKVPPVKADSLKFFDSKGGKVLPQSPEASETSEESKPDTTEPSSSKSFFGSIGSKVSLPSLSSLPSSPSSPDSSSFLLPLSKFGISGGEEGTAESPDAEPAEENDSKKGGFAAQLRAFSTNRSPTASIDPSGLLETVLGTSRSGPFGNIADILKPSGGIPGFQRLNRTSTKAAAIADDILLQAVERRKQLWKMVVIAANRVALPDTLFRFPGRGKSFTLRPEKTSSIPLQYMHRGPGAITNEMADKSCAELGVDKILEQLNDILATKYTFADKPGLEASLQDCIARGYDFGRAYGMLRPAWSADFSGYQRRLEVLQNEDEKMRAAARQGDTIVTPRIPPRRVWDLRSNRVLPFWAIADLECPDAIDVNTDSTYRGNIPSKLWAVSHAWMDKSNRQNVNTIINNHEWPAPIPTDTSLEHVRIELLNLGAEYVWLDVLCLRQEGDKSIEPIRLAEWKLDVPTIGHVYQYDRYQTVITYFNGLGRPFTMSPAIITGSLHWINRVWTLQETTPTWLPGGMTISLFDKAKHGEQVRPGLFEQVQRLCAVIALNPPDVFAVIGAVQDRSYSNAVDRVGAVGYLLRLDTLPTYDPSEDPEGVWERLVYCLSDKHRTDMLVLYPLRGDAWARWAPSWYQLMQLEPPSVYKIPYAENEYLRATKDEDGKVTYYHYGYVMEDCRVHLTTKREGIIDITHNETLYHFKMAIDHSQPIGAGKYILVGVAELKHLVLGNCSTTRVVDGRKEFEVEKISVIRIHNPDRSKLRELNPGLADAKVIYI